MKAKDGTRVITSDRTKLETVIPLHTPYIINIDPCDVCNLQCRFCPNCERDLIAKIPGRYHGSMDFEIYKKIIDDCCGFPEKVKVIRLYGCGEPLANPRFADMVEYAHKSGCCVKVDTTTNAVLLTHEMSDKIIAAGLDRINISINGVNREQYLDFAGTNIDFEKLVENITYFYQHRNQCTVFIKIVEDILTDEQKKQFYDIFGEISDIIDIEKSMDVWPQYGYSKIDNINREVGIYGNPLVDRLVCPYVMYSLMIHSDGCASYCFLDWNRKHVFADCKSENTVSVWNGKTFTDFKKMMLRGERKNDEICAHCSQLNQGVPDDIDAFAGELLKKFEEDSSY